MTPFELNCSTFRSLYPGLTEDVISDEMLQALWGVIEALLGDGEGNFPYPESTIQTILYTALCHLATLETNGMNQPGRIASASGFVTLFKIGLSYSSIRMTTFPRLLNAEIRDSKRVA